MTEQAEQDFYALDERLEELRQRLADGMTRLRGINVRIRDSNGEEREALLEDRVRLAGKLDGLAVEVGETAKRRALAELAHLREVERTRLAEAEIPMAEIDVLADQQWGNRQLLEALEHRRTRGEITSQEHASEQERIQEEMRRADEQMQVLQVPLNKARNAAKLARVQAQGRYHVTFDAPEERWLKAAEMAGAEAAREARKELRRRFGPYAG